MYVYCVQYMAIVSQLVSKDIYKANSHDVAWSTNSQTEVFSELASSVVCLL